MKDTNYISSVVRMLDNPKQLLINDSLLRTTCRAQLPGFDRSQFVTLTFWGNRAIDTLKYYTTNDYILVEGYVSLREDSLEKFNSAKKVNITVLRSYPCFLNSTQQATVP
mgnify:CR=1 FL=1